MSDIEDLRPEAEKWGIKVHGNMKPETLAARIDEARAEAEMSADDEPNAEKPVTKEPTAEEPEVANEPVVDEDDGWPTQIAPLAWLDQEGRRYTDLGEAIAGAQECRERDR